MNSKSFFLTKQRTPTSGGPAQSLVGVEAYAIEHYMKERGWPRAIHAENSTFSTLFALVMWDVMFAPVPDVFRAPFQVSG